MAPYLSWLARLVAGLLLAGTLAAGAAHADSLGDVRTGNAAFGDGRYEAAVEAFTRAILAGDLDHEALAITLNNRGVAYSELGDYDRAIADYQQGLALVPGDPTATRNLRIAYTRRAAAAARLGDRAAALADYNRAIELEPTHPLAYLRRGQLALERGDRAAAVADLTKAHDLDPQNADVTALLAGAERMPEASTHTEAPPPIPAPPPTQASPADQAAEAAPPAAAAPADDYSIDPPEQPAPSTASPPDVAPAAGGPGRPYRALADVNVRAGPGNEYPRVGGITEGAAAMVVGGRLGWLQLRLDGGGTGWVYGKWLQEVAGAEAGQQ